MLTISEDIYDRNLTLAQDGEDLVLGLRSEDTDSNGTDDGRPVARLENVLPAGKWTAIDLGIRPGSLTIAIDGKRELDVPLPPSVLSTWNPSYSLALGNEMTCNRPWLGEIRNPVITAPNGRTNYAEARAVDRPDSCWAREHLPKLMPLVQLDLADAARNLAMYVPLGVLLGLMSRERSAGMFGVLVLAIGGVSLAFECTQLLVASRFPSVDDVIFNTLGGALGLGFGFWLMQRMVDRLPDR